jgi:hypothetical protein
MYSGATAVVQRNDVRHVNKLTSDNEDYRCSPKLMLSAWKLQRIQRLTIILQRRTDCVTNNEWSTRRANRNIVDAAISQLLCVPYIVKLFVPSLFFRKSSRIVHSCWSGATSWSNLYRRQPAYILYATHKPTQKVTQFYYPCSFNFFNWVLIMFFAHTCNSWLYCQLTSSRFHNDDIIRREIIYIRQLPVQWVAVTKVYSNWLDKWEWSFLNC